MKFKYLINSGRMEYREVTISGNYIIEEMNGLDGRMQWEFNEGVKQGLLSYNNKKWDYHEMTTIEKDKPWKGGKNG